MTAGLTQIRLDAETLAGTHRQVLDALLARAYKQGDFTLASGERSDYYLDCKQVSLSPDALAVGALLLARVLDLPCAAVGGPALGAVPLVAVVSALSALGPKPLPAFVVRKEAKGHGTRTNVEGTPLAAGTPVALLEDVVTTGGSVQFAIDAARALNYKVEHVVCIVDRERGGAERLAEQGIALHALFQVSELRAATR